MDEIWKDKKDYEGHYQVSNFGRVKSIKFGKERILKPLTNSSGYLCVNLYKNGIIKTYLVHRLVAEIFLPNPNNYKEVNHKDEDKSNNIVSNLEWCDRCYNNNYGTRTEKFSKKVYQYTLDGQFVKEWPSTCECGRNGYSQSSVSACCRDELKTYKGFIWSYNNFLHFKFCSIKNK